MAHHVARQLGQADLLGGDSQRFLDVDAGYDDRLGVTVVRPMDCRPGLALLRLAEGRALTELFNWSLLINEIFLDRVSTSFLLLNRY